MQLSCTKDSAPDTNAFNAFKSCEPRLFKTLNTNTI